MQTRRGFLKSSALLAGAAGASSLLPAAVQKAFAIAPDPGTTYLNAEHIVVLMQENRSFDHMFGTLRGVRGFNDRRTIRQGDGASVFIQRDATGKAYAPWHVSLKETQITWMGDIPHARSDHLDAWNGGAHDNWIAAKASSRYPDVPITLAYHTRQDLPFYYALADAFTVCDQNFAAGLLETAPNRLHLWSGTLREPHETGSLAYLKNWQTQPGALAWTSFPERLEAAGVSWKFYQNDSWCESPLTETEARWLGNDGDNTVERFAAVKSEFSPAYKKHTLGVLDGWQDRVSKRKAELEQQLAALAPTSAEAQALRNWIAAYAAQEQRLQRKRLHGNDKLSELSAAERSIHSKVITTNGGDPDFRSLETIQFEVDGRQETMQAPKGDVLYQFRRDVAEGKLPTVSWLVAAANFSAHPGAPFYGAWYISEVMNILTENPGLWKKTIFIVTFDENDGLFDHVPPFVACDPRRPESGKVSAGLDAAPEYAYAEDERIQGTPEKDVRDGPIGFGYRVPMIVASPWSRGGWVNSQVCEHSSIVRFIETFVARKFGKQVRQEEISSWRRAISGDLTSCFRPCDASQTELPFIERDAHLADIEKARGKPLPNGFREIPREAYAAPDAQKKLLQQFLWQEEGLKPACALPYELSAQGAVSFDRRHFEIALTADNALFGERAAGAPFNVYLYGVKDGSRLHSVPGIPANVAMAAYAVKAGDVLRDRIDLGRFAGDAYDIEVYGPNGFFRHFKGTRTAAAPELSCTPRVRKAGSASARLEFTIQNPTDRAVSVRLRSSAYVEYGQQVKIAAGKSASVAIDLKDGERWYDLTATVEGMADFLQRYAGRVETGAATVSDPMIGLAAASRS